MAKPGPNLAIALAMEHGLIQKLANSGDQFGVGKNPRTTLLRLPRMPLAMSGGRLSPIAPMMSPVGSLKPTAPAMNAVSAATKIPNGKIANRKR